MKELRNSIMNYLFKIENMNWENLLLILNPLGTVEQAKEFLQFLQTNKRELAIKKLTRKSLEIAKKLGSDIKWILEKIVQMRLKSWK